MRVSASLLTLLALGCGSAPPRIIKAGAPVITTGALLPVAAVDADYQEPLQVSGGQGALTFSLKDVPAELAWIQLDASTGLLSGRPTATVDPGLPFQAIVADASGQSTTATLTLTVHMCVKEGQEVDCFVADSGGSCLQNKVLCSSGGAIGTCNPSQAVPSLNMSHCGAASGACGICSPTAADSCDGTCLCGSSPACSGSTPSCCSGACVDTDTDPTSCGQCGHPCPATGPAGSHPTCAAGQCGWECDGNLVKCGDACVDPQTDPNHCGGCSGQVCSGTTPTCSAGTCVPDCGSLVNCNGSCVDTSKDLANCGGCTTSTVSHACTTSVANATATCSAGTCTSTCNTGYTPCGSACVNIQADVSNCGGCTTSTANYACSTSVANGIATCVSGACSFRCRSGVYCRTDDACELGCLCSDTCGGGGTGGGSGGGCFVAGTPVTLADGSIVPIEEVGAGDQVLSFNPETDSLELGTVQRLLVHADTPALLRINGRLTTTPEHHFFSNGRWIRADNLDLGDPMLRADGAGSEPVVELELLQGPETVYNLDVLPYHDYFADGVLVHNMQKQ